MAASTAVTTIEPKIISVDPNLRKRGNDIQMQSIGNQLSLYLYQKPLSTSPSGVLGQAQVIKSSQRKLKEVPVTVVIPHGILDDSDLVRLRLGYIRNMVNHARKEGLPVKLQMQD